MARLKKPINYIEELLRRPETKILGEKLQKQYYTWIKNLKIEDFYSFIDLIEENKQVIGAAQFFGKFRAYSLEEYVYRLLRERCCMPESLEIYWGEKCLISKSDNAEYCMESDIIVGEKLDCCIKPKIVVDAKVELDASRFKTAIGTFMLIKQAHPNVKCFLVYLKRELNNILLRLANPWIDGIHCFHPKLDETELFIESVQDCFFSQVSKI